MYLWGLLWSAGCAADAGHVRPNAAETAVVADVQVSPKQGRPGDTFTCAWSTTEGPAEAIWIDAAAGTVLGEGPEFDSTGVPVATTITCHVCPVGTDVGCVDDTAVLPGNVFVVLFDDVGAHRLATYGADGPEVPETPTIDALAASGLTFDHAWAMPLCSPTRAVIQTGRYPYRHGVGHSLAYTSKHPLPYEERTIAEMLDEGTGSLFDHSMIGKWHLASHTDGERAFRDHPNAQGWNHFSGLMIGLDDNVTTDGEPQTWFDWEETTNGVVARNATYVTTDQIDDAIERAEAMEEPWVMVVALFAAHAPYVMPPIELTSGVRKGELIAQQENAFMIEAADHELGRFYDRIDSGLAARTTTILLGDNGTPAKILGDEEASSKGTVSELGVHVPFIVAGPYVAEPGTRTDALVNVADVFATVADLSLVPLVPDEVDGVSFVGVLSGTDPDGLRTTNYAEDFVPSGFGPYDRYEQGVRDACYKLTRDSADGDALFDLCADPEETVNLLSEGHVLLPDERAALDRLAALLPDFDVDPCTGRRSPCANP